MLVPELHPSDIVVMENLPAQKGTRVGALIEATGARLRLCLLAAPQPRLQPTAIAKLEALTRKAAGRQTAGFEARSVDDAVEHERVTIPRRLRPATSVVVFQWPCGFAIRSDLALSPDQP